MLQILDQVPDRLLQATAQELSGILDGPALIHLEGRRPERLFISVLLHGNEDVGLKAVQQVLANHAAHGLPRAVSLFVGNITAARANVRRLEGQPDYNRVWPGSEDDGTPEHALMRRVIDEMSSLPLFASVDLHNNTGWNPLYGCINRLELPFLHLASWFSRTVVYFERPRGVQSMAFSKLCPAITCECGKVGDPQGVERAAEFLEACLHAAEIPNHALADGDVHLFHTVATVKIPEEVTFGFGDEPGDLCFPADLDRRNFQELEPGAILAWQRAGGPLRFDVRDQAGNDVTGCFLENFNGTVRLRRPVMPAMLTHDARVIRQDCLGYLMERLALP